MLLDKIKLILGINSSEYDDILTLLAEEVTGAVINYTRVEEMSASLEALTARITADIFIKEGFTDGFSGSAYIRALTEGERKIEFNTDSGNYLSEYVNLLYVYKDKKGRVPSDF